MHPGQTFFNGIKIIDYRNARYQGYFNSKIEKRQGFGILIDDDMNIYCSQWEDGKLSGLTFIYLANGNYFYGYWRNNQPHGINIYRNKQFILIGVYHKGNNIGVTLAITDAINHMLVFNGQDILTKQKSKDIELLTTENILQINFFEDVISHTAKKNNIQLNKFQLTLFNFLTNFAEKYSENIKLIYRGGYYYFGFQIGLGFRFTLLGKVNHRIGIASIGSHEDDRITDFGVKYHQSRCIEQGNFNLKQTITYNRISDRPRQKCLAIFQKNHKKSLNFINEYYQNKISIISIIQNFLSSKLGPRYQQNIKNEYELKKYEKISQKQGQKKQMKQDYLNRLKGQKKIQRNISSKSLLKNRSISNINSKPNLRNNLTPVKKNKGDYLHQQSIDFQQYQIIQDQLNNFYKKDIGCQRCRSKQKKNQNKLKKSPQKKSKSKSKSNLKIGGRQIKYLKNYQIPAILLTKSNDKKQNKRGKSFTNLPQSEQFSTQKQKLRIENEMKIRKQIYQRQIQRDAKIFHGQNYPLTFSELLRREESVNNILSPRNNEIKLSKFNPIYEYSPIVRYDQNIQNMLLDSVSSIKKIQILQNRRDRILKQFKQLNTIQPYIYDNKYDKNNKNNLIYDNKNKYNYNQYNKQKDKIYQFNKKYRNYLDQENKYPIIYNQNYQQPQFYLDHDIIPNRHLSSLSSDNNITKQIQSKNLKPVKQRKKYEYFFDKNSDQ